MTAHRAHPFDRRFVAPLAVGTMLNPVNSSLISTAMVPIAETFRATAAETAWLITGLYLASAVAQPAMGKLADLLGPRRVFLSALSLVAAAGLVGMVAPSLGVLVATRVMIGIGTSGAYPAAMRMFRDRADRFDTVPPRLAIGMLSLSSLSVAAIGPFLGGLLTSAFGWHAVFAINLPLALGTMAMIALWSPADHAPGDGMRRLFREFDWLGMLLFAASLIATMLFLMRLSAPDWPLLSVALLLGAAWLGWSWRRERPFLDIRMMTDNLPLLMTYLRLATIMTIVYCVFYGFAQWMQAAGGYSPKETGLLCVPMSVIAALSALAAMRARSIRTPFLVAAAASLLGSLIFHRLSHAAPAWVLATGIGLFGFPMGLASTATQAALYIQAPPEQIGTAAGLQRTFAYLGSITSASLLALFFGARPSDGGFHKLMAVLIVVSIVLLVAVAADPTLSGDLGPRRRVFPRA